MKKLTWSESENDELWQHDTFDNVQECIDDAIENYKMKKGETIAIGFVFPYIASIDAESVLEEIENYAYDECGESCESWINYKDKESIDELSNRLTACLNQWLKETKQEPTFYRIDDIETIKI